MNRKILTRLLSVLLVVVMTFGLLPVSASAAWWWPWNNTPETQPAKDTEPVVAEQAATDSSEFIRVFHLDCGRKYFSVDNIKTIIGYLADNHYTHLELAFGNDGLRFLLNDMSLKVGDENYTSSEVTTAIHNGNNAYNASAQNRQETNAKELTQAEMDEIIAYAKTKGIQIIPMFDAPGHMFSVISAIESLTGTKPANTNPTTSGTSKNMAITPTDETGVAFIEALVEKYIAYFADKGSTYFNIAGDECGFSSMETTEYTAYINLMNTLNAKVRSKNMTTLMFNDGVYYKNKTSNTTLDTDIVICYWSGGDNYATSTELAAKGFKLLNTNVHYYYVAGNDGGSSTQMWTYNYAINSMTNVACNVCDGGGAKTDFGCMLAYWCDTPSANVDYTKLESYIKTLAQNNTDYFKETETPKLTITSSSTSNTLKKGGTMLLTASEAATWSVDKADVVRLSVDAENDTQVSVTAEKTGDAVITAIATADISRTATYAVTVTDSDTIVTDTKTIELTVGETAKTDTQDGVNNENDVSETADTDIATVTVTGSDGEDSFAEASTITSGESYYISDGTNFLSLGSNGLINVTDRANATKWTFTSTNGGYKINSGNTYLRYTTSNGLTTGSSANASIWVNGTNGLYYYYYYYYYYYIRFSNNSWSASRNSSGNYGKPYAGVKTDPSTTITFTPVAAGTTHVTVGTTRYTIIVNAKEDAKTISMNYTETVDLANQIDEKYGVVEYQLTSGDTIVSLADGKVTSNSTDGQATVVATVTRNGKAVATYTFTINVTKVNLDGVADLPIQLWITNVPIQVKQDGFTSTNISGYGNEGAEYLKISAKKAYGVNGVPLSECVPDLVLDHDEYNGMWWVDNSESEKPAADFKLYKGVRLTVSGSNYQTTWGTSMVNSGDSFQYVRYYGDEGWAVSNDRATWLPVTGTGTDKNYSSSSLKEQLIAYYYMRTKLTDEVITDVVDWGDSINKQSDYALLDYAVKYPSGTRLPDTFPTDKTLVYGVSNNVIMSNDYRIIDQIDVTNNTGFELYMITLTPTKDLSGTLSSSTKYTYNYDEEKVIWVKTVEDLPDDYQSSTRWYTEQSGYSGSTSFPKTKSSLTFDATTGKNVGGNPLLEYVEIAKGTGLLITYYIRPVATDTLLVKYVDKTTGSEFYHFDIAVEESTRFDTQPTVSNGQMEDYPVDGLYGKRTFVYSNLLKIDGVPSAYRYAKYQFVNVEISEDKKTMTLYYTFTRDFTFIADFGLPVNIPMSEFVETTELNKLSTVTTLGTAKYGTVEYHSENKTLTYTPTKTLPGLGTLAFRLTFDDNSTKNVTIGVIPASNVLYEENFLTTATGSGWTKDNATITNAQELQKANDTETTYNVFGRDNAYDSSNGENGFWKADNLSTTTATGELTTEFYGNGFDLIGNCGPTTGMVMIAIVKKGETKAVAGAIVDTRYKENIYQVPLAHIMLKEEANYTVHISATGTKGDTTASQAAVYAAPSAMNANDVVADMLAKYGLSADEVMYIGGDQIASSPIAVQSAPAIAIYADTITRQAGKEVEIDSFRVYRSTTVEAGTTSIAASYPENEQNVTYTNIIKLMGNTVITATVEDGSVTSIEASKYEAKGGPQNEVYLANGQSIVLGVTRATEIQVSLRAVKSPVTWSNGTINSITEMYYPLTVSNEGTVTITNKGDKLLAIGNVKVPTGATVTPPSQISNDVLLASVRAAYAGTPEPVEETFTPDTFKANATSLRLIRNKVVTLNISVSKDVSYVTVNGKTYTPSRLFSRWVKNATILVTDTIGRNESRTYTIIAYNADGTASEPIVVKG